MENALATEGVLQHVTSIGVASSGSVIRVGATDQQVVAEAIQRQLGAGASVTVEAGSAFISFVSRHEASGSIVAGAGLVGANGNACTAGYSAKKPDGEKRGKTEYLYFVLTAGHCFLKGTLVGREISKNGEGREIGRAKLNGMEDHPPADGGAVQIDENLRSHSVLNGDPLQAEPIQGDQPARVGRKVCWSGKNSGHKCGIVKFYTQIYEESKPLIVYVAKGISMSGDSGGPVWDPETHKAVGLITGASPEFAKCWKQSKLVVCNMMGFTSLRPGPGAPGIEPALGVQVLKQE